MTKLHYIGLSLTAITPKECLSPPPPCTLNTSLASDPPLIYRVSLVSRSIWQKNNPREIRVLPVQFTDLTRFAALSCYVWWKGRGQVRLINSMWPYAAVTLLFCFLVGSCTIHILTVHRRGRKWFERFAEYKNKCFANRRASLVQKSATLNPMLHQGTRGKEKVAATAEPSSLVVVCRSTAVIPNPRNQPRVQDYLISAESGLAFQHRLQT